METPTQTLNRLTNQVFWNDPPYSSLTQAVRDRRGYWMDGQRYPANSLSKAEVRETLRDMMQEDGVEW